MSATELLSVIDLERALAAGWQGTTVRPLGQWLLRAGAGFTGRANSVLPLGDPGVPLAAALDEVGAFYAEHGLPAVAQLPVTGVDDELTALDEELGRRGWRSYNDTWVMLADLGTVLAACPPHPTLPPAVFEDRPSPQWLTGYLYRGQPLPPSAIDVLVRADRPVFAAVRDAAGQAGVARGALHGGLLGVTAVTVDTSRRRAGVGRHLMGELARWASVHGADTVYLQVDQQNQGALTLYGGLGFRRHHAYHYRTPGP